MTDSPKEITGSLLDFYMWAKRMFSYHALTALDSYMKLKGLTPPTETEKEK